MKVFHISEDLKEYSYSIDCLSILFLGDPGVKVRLNKQQIKLESPMVILTGGIQSLEVAHDSPLKNSYLIQVNTISFGIDLMYMYTNNVVVGYFDAYYGIALKEAEYFRQIEGTLSEIQKEYKRDKLLGNEMVGLLIQRFLIKFLRYYKESSAEKEFVDSFELHPIVGKYVRLINIHFRTRKHLSDYAEMLNVSSKTLSNIFVKYGLKSPAKLLKERIIQEAKYMKVKFPNITGKQIAFELGFINPNNFFVLFKNMEGIAFLHYARQNVLDQ